MDESLRKYHIPRIKITVAILLIITAIHAFRLGTLFSGDYYILYYSYASDLMLPFGFYFLLTLNEVNIKILRSWKVKAIVIFALCLGTEIGQVFGLEILGSTFDYFDILAFAFGVIAAVIFDIGVLRKFVPNWRFD